MSGSVSEAEVKEWLADRLGSPDMVRAVAAGVAEFLRDEWAKESARQPLLTYEDLAARWKMSPRRVRDRVAKLGLAPVKNLGGRTVRFRLASVLKAEEDAERGPKRRGLLG